MTIRHVRRGPLATAAAMCALIATGAGAQTAPAAVQAAAEPEEIVVTANRRSERLIEVPMAVLAVDADLMTRRGVQQLTDLAAHVPGLNFTSTGGVGQTSLVLRGVTTGADTGPLVGIYVDDIPYGSPTPFTGTASYDLDLALFDLERVEVLKGPQGTLYGASSMGGLVKYVERLPSFTETRVRAEAEAATIEGGEMDWSLRGAVSVPLSDKAAVGLTAYKNHFGGLADDPARGIKNIDDTDVEGARANLRLQPSEALSVRLTGVYQEIERDASSFVDVDLETQAPLFGRRGQSRQFPEASRTRFRLAAATVGYEFDFGNLLSVTSWQKNSSRDRTDASPAYGPLLVDAVGSDIIDFPRTASYRKITQEVRLTSASNGQLEWIVGGFYTDENIIDRQQLIALTPDLQPLPVDIVTINLPAGYEEYSAFGDLTYYLSDQLDVMVGARVGRNKVTSAQGATGLLEIESFPPISNKETVDTYLATLRYRPSADTTFYLRAASGYRPGGPNSVPNDPITGQPLAPPSYGSDSLWNYEAGVKHGFWDGRAYVELSGFYIDWTNIQLLVTSNNITGIGNGGDARSAGFELSGTLKPIEGLSLSGAVAYTDAEMTRIDPDSVIGAFKGDPLPSVPEWSFATALDYSFAVGGIEAQVGLTWNHIGSRLSGFDTRGVRLGAYDLVGARLSADFGGVRATLFAANLLDEDGELSYGELDVGRMSYTRPRRVGLQLSTTF